MKRIITTLLCALMIFSIGGCQNNTDKSGEKESNSKILTDNEDIYKKLKNSNYSFTLEYLDNDSDEEAYSLDINGPHNMTFLRLNDKDEYSTFSILDDSTDQSSVFRYYLTGSKETLKKTDTGCEFDYRTTKKLTNSVCVDTELKKAEKSFKEFESYFKDLETDGEHMFAFCEWYIKQNGKQAKDDFNKEKAIKETQEKKDAEKQAKEDAEKQKQEEQAKKEAKAAEEKKKAETPTMGELNALSKANDYLNYSAFSKSGLVEQLEYEGFSNKEAKYGADHCGADWKEQAAKKAKDYMDYDSFSKQGLIDQLLYEGFTQSQAEHGASAVGY